jgi:transcriptional regulator with XRE-family HTH domain
VTLRQLREARHLSQNQVARLSSISQQFLSKLELGVLQDMSFAAGVRVARTLRVTPSLLNDVLTVTRLTNGNYLKHEGTACLKRLESRIGRVLARSIAASAPSSTSDSMVPLPSDWSPSDDDSGHSSEPPAIEP